MLIVLVIQLTTDDTVDALTPAPQPVTADVSRVTYDDRQPVTVAVSFAQPRDVFAPSWSGLVTASPVHPGQELTTGQVVLEIDGVARVAHAAPRPLHRPLTEGESGTDVESLTQLLGDMGFDALRTRSRYDASVRTAVRAFAKFIGAESDGRTFDPSWLVWLPTSPYTASEVLVRAGQPAPPGGSPVFRESKSVTSIGLTGEAGLVVLNGKWVLAVGALRIPLVDGKAANDRDLQPLALIVGDTGDTTVAGQVFRAEPRTLLAVASSALVPSTDGERFCVFIVSRGGLQPMAVTPGGAAVSSTEVVKGLAEGQRYLANPGEVDVPKCP